MKKRGRGFSILHKLSVQKNQVRKLARLCAEGYVHQREELGHPLLA